MNLSELRLVMEVHQQAFEANKPVRLDPKSPLAVVKRIMWMVLLTASFLIFYLMSKLAEAIALL